MTTDEILISLGQRWLLTKSLLVNLVLVPLLTFAFVLAVPMETGHVVGLLLIVMAPGAPFGPKLAEISNSDVAFASGLMAVLGVVSVATIPITVALLMPGDVSAEPLGIARIVVVTQLIPLIGGLGVKARFQSVATRLHPLIQRLSTVLLVLLIILLTLVYAGEMRQLVGTGTLFISVAVVGAALLLGYALVARVKAREKSSPRRPPRETLPSRCSSPRRVSATQACSPSSLRSDSSVSSSRVRLRVSGADPAKRDPLQQWCLSVKGTL
ncbi:bile acid:sodium symporter [Haloplanus ruber]|uniref:Bile acid:sodium symporter n=1 Tax=Haloplanus ruber TaxID=869892 RepID=A0ABD6D1L8_9EURY